MKLFSRWLIIVCSTLTGCYFVAQAGGFTGLIKNDSSYLGLTIMFLAIGATAYMSKICQDIDSTTVKNDPKFQKDIQKRLDIVKFIADRCFDLGLLSTLIGLVLMFLGMGNDITSVIGAIKNGLSTAFIPTLVGMVANFIVSLQVFMVEHELKE